MLERLARSDHRPELVVTRPDRPRGRGRRVAPPPVAEKARALGIAVAQPESVNSEEARTEIASADPDVVTICAYGGLIREPLLFSYEMLNVHPSLLPRWRGPAPIERAIDAGDRETGVSIMRPVAEMDAGPVCLARAEPIRVDDDFGRLAGRLERLGGDLLVETLDTRPPCKEQPDHGVTVAAKITPEDRRLDPKEGADRLERRVRALSPHIGAYLELDGGERLQILRARLRPGEGDAGAGLRAAGESLLLDCADGALELLVVKPAGGRAMEGTAYARGRAVTLGIRPPEPPQ